MSELRRVGQDNGDALIEHFMSKATVQVEYINQQRDMWSDFLDFFGSGDANMFDTDEEFEEPAPPEDQPAAVEEELPPVEEALPQVKTYVRSSSREISQPVAITYKRQDSQPLTIASQVSL